MISPRMIGLAYAEARKRSSHHKQDVDDLAQEICLLACEMTARGRDPERYPVRYLSSAAGYRISHPWSLVERTPEGEIVRRHKADALAPGRMCGDEVALDTRGVHVDPETRLDAARAMRLLSSRTASVYLDDEGPVVVGQREGVSHQAITKTIKTDLARIRRIFAQEGRRDTPHEAQ